MVVPQFIRKLEVQLQHALPGVEAQKKMGPVPRKIPSFIIEEDDATPSAVLILLFADDDKWLFLLTERSSQVEHHQGQVSLPGGAQESEETLQQTALREAHEELGIDTEKVTMLGELTPLFIPVSGFRVHPFVGWTSSRPQIRPDAVEVVSVPIVSANELLARENIKREKWDIHGTEVDVPVFDFTTTRVWGATAMILSEFREVLCQIEEI